MTGENFCNLSPSVTLQSTQIMSSRFLAFLSQRKHRSPSSPREDSTPEQGFTPISAKGKAQAGSADGTFLTTSIDVSQQLTDDDFGVIDASSQYISAMDCRRGARSSRKAKEMRAKQQEERERVMLIRDKDIGTSMSKRKVNTKMGSSEGIARLTVDLESLRSAMGKLNFDFKALRSPS